MPNAAPSSLLQNTAMSSLALQGYTCVCTSRSLVSKQSWCIAELLPVRAVRHLVNNLQNHNFKSGHAFRQQQTLKCFFSARGLLSSSRSMSLLLLDMSPLSTLSCFTCFPLDFLFHKLFTILCLFSLPAPPLSRYPSRLLKGLLLWDRVCERES